jgi:hypothetical protein
MRPSRRIAQIGLILLLAAAVARVVVYPHFWGSEPHLQKTSQETAGDRRLSPPAAPGERQAIRISQRGLAHTLERHGPDGPPRFADKSKFDRGVDIPALIALGQNFQPRPETNGYSVRSFDAGATVGFDRNARHATSVVTVVTRADGELVTAYPGFP